MKHTFTFLQTLIPVIFALMMILPSSSARAAIRVEGGLVNGVTDDGMTVYNAFRLRLLRLVNCA